jgi:excisionase family DNA binding protein
MNSPALSTNIPGDFLTAALAAPPGRLAAALRILTGEAALAAADDRPLLMTIVEAARRLNVSATTVRRAIKAGRIQKVEIYQGAFRLRRSDVEAIAFGGSR